MVATGLLSEADAMASPHAHVVTRWLGADAEDAEPHVDDVPAAGTRRAHALLGRAVELPARRGGAGRLALPQAA